MYADHEKKEESVLEQVLIEARLFLSPPKTRWKSKTISDF